MDSSNKIANRWVLIYSFNPFKIIDAFFADMQGSIILDSSNTVETFTTEVELEQRVAQLEEGKIDPAQRSQDITQKIREKYSLDEELALNSKSISIANDLCTDEQKARWTQELKDFVAYREQCIKEVDSLL